MHVPHVQTVQKAIEVPQIAYIDRVVDVPVEKQVHVPHVQNVQKVIEVPQIALVEKHVHVPHVQKVQKTGGASGCLH